MFGMGPTEWIIVSVALLPFAFFYVMIKEFSTRDTNEEE